MQEYLEIGQIVSTHGIKGSVKVNPFTDDMSRFDDLKKLYIETKSGLKEVLIEQVSYHKNQVILKFKDIDSIEEVNQYRNCYLKIDRQDAVKLPKNSYFIVDLMECEVYDEAQNYVGKVVDIFPTGSNDVYVVKKDNGKDLLLPAIKEVIKNVDIESKKIIVNLIEGLDDEI